MSNNLCGKVFMYWEAVRLMLVDTSFHLESLIVSLALFSVVCNSWFAMVYETQLSTLNSVFSDIKLVV